jgi:glutamate-1-semialdehyde 2,1-aminomutase
MAAGIATLKALQAPGFYENLDARTEKLVAGLKSAAAEAGIGFCAGHVGSMGGFFFTPGPVHNFNEAKESNLERFSAFYKGMRDRGI